MKLAEIARTGKGAFENLIATVGGDSSLKYPLEIAKTVTNKIDENDRSWQESRGYAFRVVRILDGQDTITADEGWDEFVLQINPQELTQDEIFAIQVTPTLSGVMVEHQSVTLKDITISGTTGISPGRREGGSYPRNGRPVFGAGRSGYYEFHELRSYIRTYAEAKRNDKDSKNGELRLVWRNYKDREDLFVEPQKFTMKRSSSKPMSYDYTIQLKAIGTADLADQKGSWLDPIDDIIQGVQDTLDSAVKIIQGSIGFVEQFERDATNTILGPLNAVTAFVEEFKNADQRLLYCRERVSRHSMEKMKEDLARVYDNGMDYLGRNDEGYDEATGRDSTLYREEGNVSYEQERTMNALKKSKIAMSHLIKTDAFFDSTIDGEREDIERVYGNSRANVIRSANESEKFSLTAKISQAKLAGNIKAASEAQKALDDIIRSETRGGVSSSPVKFDTARFMKVVVVEAGHTIQTLAVKHLGSVDAYRDLILLNNLKPPYVNSTPVDEQNLRVAGVLRPGDKLYVPQAGSPGSSSGVGGTREYPITFGQDEIEKRYGVDIKLDKNFDIDINSIGDVKLVSGGDNVAQALILKLLYEVGSLKRHPGIGTSLGVGRKAANVQEILSQVRKSLISDPRVDAILYSEVIQESGALLINVVIRLMGSDLVVRFPVRIQE